MNKKNELMKILKKKQRDAKKVDEKTYISTLDENVKRPNTRMLTGMLTLDYLLNGTMEGSLYEITGNEGAGKSTLCWRLIEKLQYIYPGIDIYYNDIEGTSKDEQFLNRFPLLKRKEVIIDAVQDIEKFFETLESIASYIDLAVIDTVSVLDLKNKIDLEKSEMGKVAGIMTRGWKRFHDIARDGIRVLAINQTRDKLDPYSANYGPNTPGGRAYHYALTGQIEIKRDGGQSKAEKETDVFGNEKIKSWNTAIKIFKNKQGPFGKSINTVLNTSPEKNITFDEVKELIAFAKVYGYIETAGMTNNLINFKDGTKLISIKGKDNLENYICENIDYLIELKMNVYKSMLTNDFFYCLFDKLLMIARAEKVMFEIKKKMDFNKPIQKQLEEIKIDEEKVLEEMKEKFKIEDFFDKEELDALINEFGEPWTFTLKKEDEEEIEED